MTVNAKINGDRVECGSCGKLLGEFETATGTVKCPRCNSLNKIKK